MIEASFNPEKSTVASVAGAVQYDTGQRLRLRGLPSPEELAERDDFLSGDVVTVQVQYAYDGDSQTESRLASYDEDEGAWLVAVPDTYLQKSYPVGFYVYVGYGADEETQRSKTLYMGAFQPKKRPAPGDQVTSDQLNAWDALVSEINLSLSAMGTATSNANAAASSANTAATQAAKWGNATASATTLEAGSAATVEVTEVNGVRHIIYGIPRGATGATGAKGEKGDTGPAGVTFTLSGATLTITTTS